MVGVRWNKDKSGQLKWLCKHTENEHKCAPGLCERITCICMARSRRVAGSLSAITRVQRIPIDILLFHTHCLFILFTDTLDIPLQCISKLQSPRAYFGDENNTSQALSSPPPPPPSTNHQGAIGVASAIANRNRAVLVTWWI